MEHCDGLKVIKVLKLTIHVVLFFAFIILTSLAFRDLISNQTTVHVSQQYKKLILPSFTTCLYADKTGKFNESTLASNASNIIYDMKWATLPSLYMKFPNGTFMYNETEQFYKKQGYCKPAIAQLGQSGCCIPCITWNGNLMLDEIDQVYVSLFICTKYSHFVFSFFI